MTPKQLPQGTDQSGGQTCHDRSFNAEVPTALLINAARSAWMGSMSVSWWHEAVRQGRAPAPVIRGPRCTRWRSSDVQSFWEELAEKGGEPEEAERLVKQSMRASRAAQLKRASVAHQVGSSA